MGSLPFSSMYFSISRFSKTVPVFLETTGSSGASPETVVCRLCQLMIDQDDETDRLAGCLAGWLSRGQRKS